MFTPNNFDSVIDKPSHCHDDDAGDWEVEGPHHLPHVLPVLPQLEATIGQTKAPRIGTNKGVEAELPEVHACYTRRHTYKPP